MTVIRLPVEYDTISLAKDEENVFWKQIIPLDKEIFYGGNKLKFDRKLLERLKENYDAKVLQQTAFQLADDSNNHETPGAPLTENFDPQRYRGEVQELKVDSGGLTGKFKLTAEGAKLIADNPKLGVSASIKPNYKGEDGRVHDFVLRHVLGTLSPVIKHMSPWQREEISLSETDEPNEEVYDLTTPADTQTPDTSADEDFKVDKAEFERMKARLDEFDKGAALLDEILAAEPEETEPQPTVSLSEQVDPKIIELQNRAAAADWRAERTEFVKDGVPVAMLNLCDSVMSTYEAPTINLSDGESVDPRDVIRQVLAQAKGTVDLSDESGHGMTVDERDAERNAANDFVGGFMGKFMTDLF